MGSGDDLRIRSNQLLRLNRRGVANHAALAAHADIVYTLQHNDMSQAGDGEHILIQPR